MTPTEEAIYEQMAYIVFEERRPFCSNDFIRFDHNGTEYTLSEGSIRNIFWKFNKEGRIELDFRTNFAYYSLKGHKFGKNSITLNHTWGKSPPISPNHPLYKVLKNQIWAKEACHNIRLRVDDVPDIYNTVLKHRFPTNPVSQDIQVPYPIKDSVPLTLTIHKTNTISVALSCTNFPYH
jgi:hypothetical protein